MSKGRGVSGAIQLFGTRFRRSGFRNVVKLGKKGQVSIPKVVLDALHLEGEHWLIVDTTDDGAIVLRPAGGAPIELFDDARIAAFLEEDELTPELAARVEAALAALRPG